MTNGARPIWLLVGVFMLGAVISTLAATTDGGTPYQAIVDRNVFGLKPPAPPPDPEANKPPPPKLTLTGLYKMGGTARALIKVAVPPRPPEPAKEVPLILSEGQASEGVEVLAIDTTASIVKVNNSGTVMSLDFTNNGAKVASAAAPGGGLKPPGVGVPPAPGGFVPPVPPGAPTTVRPVRPTGLPGAAITPTSYNPASAGSSAQSVTTYTAVPGTPTYNTSSGLTVGGTASGAVTLPGLGSAASTPQAQRNWPPEPRSAEEAAIIEEAYRQRYAREIQSGDMPSIPGNSLFQDSQPQQTQTPVTTPQTPPLPPGAARRYVPQ